MFVINPWKATLQSTHKNHYSMLTLQHQNITALQNELNITQQINKISLRHQFHFNPLTSKSCDYSITLESNVWVTRIKEMIIKKLKCSRISHVTLYLFSHIQYTKYSFNLQIAVANPGGAIFLLLIRLLSTK